MKVKLIQEGTNWISQIAKLNYSSLCNFTQYWATENLQNILELTFLNKTTRSRTEKNNGVEERVERRDVKPRQPSWKLVFLRNQLQKFSNINFDSFLPLTFPKPGALFFSSVTCICGILVMFEFKTNLKSTCPTIQAFGRTNSNTCSSQLLLSNKGENAKYSKSLSLAKTTSSLITLLILSDL